MAGTGGVWPFGRTRRRYCGSVIVHVSKEQQWCKQIRGVGGLPTTIATRQTVLPPR